MKCGGAPQDSEGNRKPMVDLEVDINWGDGAYLCGTCTNLIADLIGRPPTEAYEKTLSDYHGLEKKHKVLEKRATAQTERVRSMIEGKRAEKAEANKAKRAQTKKTNKKKKKVKA